ncbi:uncharacterized protein [Diadema setosum]|uniref:uncharacterized protein n=1 Tax=Diadema setosum TaxID=31175 RepID=UPI003B3AA401
MQYFGYVPSMISGLLAQYLFLIGLMLHHDFANAIPQDPCTPKDHLGKEFVVGFLEAPPDISPQLYIVGSRRSSRVVIYTTKGNFSLDVTAYAPIKTVDLIYPDFVGSSAMLVISEHDVSVYGVDRGAQTMDSFLALPVDALGTEYYIMSYDIPTRVARDKRGSQFMVMAAHHGTSVVINFTGRATCAGQLVRSPLEVTLNRLQTITCISADEDLTGTHVVSSKPVGVVSGNRCANVPKNQRYCDHLVEQLPPVSSWDTRFITSSLNGRSGGDRFRVIASRNNTLVQTTTSAGSFILQAGEFKELEVASNLSAAIVSDYPILVMQYSKGGNIDGTGADPFMMLVPGVGQFLGEALVPTVTAATRPNLTNNFNIIIDCSSKDNLYHGIFHFPEADFVPASTATESLLGKRYCITHQGLTSRNQGLYFLEDRLSGFNSFTVLVYGYSLVGIEAYGMPAGLVLRNNSCPTPPMRIKSTPPPPAGIVCPTVGSPVPQMATRNSDVVNYNAPEFPLDHTVNDVNTEPTTGVNPNKQPTSRGNYLTVAIIIAMFSSVIIIILIIYICVLRRRLRRLMDERKALGQLRLSSMQVGPDGYIDLDGSQISQREYMTLNNTDGVWRVGKVRRVDRNLFRSFSGATGKSSSPATGQCNGKTPCVEGSFRDRRLTSTESTPQDQATATGLTRQFSITESCGGVSQSNGSTAALISLSRHGSICEETSMDSFPKLRPLAPNRCSSNRHTSVHLDSFAHGDLLQTRRQRKPLWRSVSNPGVNPFSSVHGDVKVLYEVPKNNRPLTTTGTVSSTSTHYDRPRRQRTSSEEISPAASIFLTQFPNTLSSKQDDGYMSMKDPRTSVSSQASGSHQGDVSQTSASIATSMLDKAYTSIPDENFNNANDAGDTDSTDYTELY